MNVKILVLAFVLALSMSAIVVVAAQRGGAAEKACIPQPTQELGIAAITDGIGFIMAGGMGPILMLVIAFIIGFLVSHIMWSSF